VPQAAHKMTDNCDTVKQLTAITYCDHQCHLRTELLSYHLSADKQHMKYVTSAHRHNGFSGMSVAEQLHNCQDV